MIKMTIDEFTKKVGKSTVPNVKILTLNYSQEELLVIRKALFSCFARGISRLEDLGNRIFNIHPITDYFLHSIYISKDAYSHGRIGYNTSLILKDSEDYFNESTREEWAITFNSVRPKYDNIWR